ncbi:hypothetical protein [Devosia sp. CN2-171]|uniref:hypothetical protein n=1 Tax=Devosia sp. CN2-171 TaxID=3400909 RepID=UPI003BF7BF76
MPADDANRNELALDLTFIETLRRMKARFQLGLLAASASADPGVTLSLRQESCFQLAEFLFALKSYGIGDAETLRRFAELHNQHLLDIRNDRERMQRYGLTPERLDAALFTGDNMSKLLANFSAPQPTIDQSDLARFLVTVMSTETCRKLLLASEQAGFVERIRSPFGAVLITSRGIMEEVYGKTIRETRLEAAQG